MKTSQVKLKLNADFDTALAPLAGLAADLLVGFGGIAYFDNYRLYEALKKHFPQGALAG